MENNNLVDIPEYDDYKFDLDLNQVYGIKRNRYLKNTLDKDGYHQVSLRKNKKGKTYRIHRLVYIIHNPTEDINLFDIDHIDCDKLNNKINNLRKATKSDNASNKKTYINNKLGIKHIRQYRKGYRFKLTKNKITYSKCFKNLQDAIDYRNKIVLEKCGEFTNLG
tara:strand:- start:77 stop:571 length:495 start_codon:yes stop_codon:yes gene_type:complete